MEMRVTPQEASRLGAGGMGIGFSTHTVSSTKPTILETEMGDIMSVVRQGRFWKARWSVEPVHPWACQPAPVPGLWEELDPSGDLAGKGCLWLGRALQPLPQF